MLRCGAACVRPAEVVRSADRCIITYTSTGAGEPFDGAEWVVNTLTSGKACSLPAACGLPPSCEGIACGIVSGLGCTHGRQSFRPCDARHERES